MHGRARVIIAVLALSILVIPASSRHARAAIDCAVLNAKIAELEIPNKKLREAVKGLATVLAKGSEVGISPTHSLLLMDQHGNLSNTIAKLRADVAANEPVLRDLRALRIKHCSGKPGIMAHVAPQSSAVVDSPSVQYVPTTRVYGSPVVTHRRTNLRSPNYTSPRVAGYEPGKKHPKHASAKAKKKHTAKVHKPTRTQQAHKKNGKARKTNKKHKPS